MINDVLLRWGVTGLFVLSAAVWGFAMVTQRRAWTSAVRNGLHFVMAIAMAVMVWPWGAQSPTTGPTVFFLLATAWFVTMIIVAAQTTAQRAACGYHALMMLAMAWMYADTKHHHFPNHSGMHHPTSPATPMPGMDGAATGMAANRTNGSVHSIGSGLSASRSRRSYGHTGSLQSGGRAQLTIGMVRWVAELRRWRLPAWPSRSAPYYFSSEFSR